ncbi:hypothetical protein SNOUR_34265 [Streptomyces noursei ATCC 11455]|nr:hypothetical protein SNOUR_34265 [Streptomyces noursei ATCC 11455]
MPAAQPRLLIAAGPPPLRSAIPPTVPRKELLP